MNINELLEQYELICKELDRRTVIVVNLETLSRRLDDIDGGMDEETEKVITDMMSNMNKILDILWKKKIDVENQIKQNSLQKD